MGNNPNILNKIKPKTDQELNAEKEQKIQIKKSFQLDDAELEAEISNFNIVEDDMINEKTGNVLCVVRRPTMAQWESFAPTELMVYKNPEEIPPDKAQKYNNLMFEMISELIVRPKHDAQWWKEHATQEFIDAFQNHLTTIMKKINDTTRKF